MSKVAKSFICRVCLNLVTNAAVEARIRIGWNTFRQLLQYGARDKYLSGVVAGRTASEYVAVAASADSESRVKAMRIASSAASPRLGRRH